MLQKGKGIARPLNRAVAPRDVSVLSAFVISTLTFIATFPIVDAPIFSETLDQRIRDAAAALRYRPTEARLSSEHAYRPSLPSHRGAAQRETEAGLEFLSIAAHSDESENAAGSIEHLHAGAVARLYLGQAEVAILRIEQALQRADALKLDARQRAHLWNDLAAARLEFVARGAERRHLVSALDAVERAKAADATNVSIVWTRALLLEKLNCRRAALNAWREYLRLDPHSSWAAEARAHISVVSVPQSTFTPALETQLRNALRARDVTRVQEIVRTFPKESRMFGEETLLPQWADEHLRRLPTTTLESSRLLAEEVVAANGESLLFDATEQIIAADAAFRDRIADAIIQYKTARDAYRSEQVENATRQLAIAEVMLRAVRSPLAILANVYRTASTYSENRFADAVQVADPELDPCNPGRHYFAACGLISWIKGLALLQSGHPAAALDSYDRGLATFRAVDERYNVAVMLELRAETLDFMSAADEAWGDRMTALKMFAEWPMSARPVIWMAVAQAALSEHYDRAAAVIFDEIASDARENSHAMWYAEAILWRLVATNRIEGRVIEAEIEASRRAIARISEPSIRARSQANLGLILAEVRGSESAARGDLDRALEFYRDSNDRFNGTTALRERANVRAATADFAAAGSDVVQALEEFHRQSEGMGDPFMRTLFSERSRELFLTVSGLQVARGNPVAALWSSDRARATAVRHFHGVRGSAAPSERGAEELARELVRNVPPRFTVVHQDLAGDQLRTWVIRNGHVRFFSRTVNALHLRVEIAEFRAQLQHGREDDRLIVRSKRLYDTILRPERDALDGSSPFVYSPSSELRGLPIGVLHDGDFFLIEQRPVAVTRSMSALIDAHVRSVHHTAPVLIVNGAPSGGAPALQGVKTEVAVLARWYGSRASVLEGGEATPEAVLAAVSHYDVIHIGAHGRTERQPLQNAVELSFGGRLRAFEILNQSLPRAPVVVLGGCGTDDETTGRATLSLANAFTAAGASAVLGSLWDVEDLGAMRLLVQFHKELAFKDPIEALHRAQSAVRTQVPIDVWAAFQLQI